MSNLPIVKMFKAHEAIELVLSSVLGLIYFILYGGIFVTPAIMISMLYIPFIQYFLLLIYVMISLIATYALKRTTESLKHYRTVDSVDYDTIRTRLSVAIAIVVFVTLAIVYLQYFN